MADIIKVHVIHMSCVIANKLKESKERVVIQKDEESNLEEQNFEEQV